MFYRLPVNLETAKSRNVAWRRIRWKSWKGSWTQRRPWAKRKRHWGKRGERYHNRMFYLCCVFYCSSRNTSAQTDLFPWIMFPRGEMTVLSQNFLKRGNLWLKEPCWRTSEWHRPTFQARCLSTKETSLCWRSMRLSAPRTYTWMEALEVNSTAMYLEWNHRNCEF